MNKTGENDKSESEIKQEENEMNWTEMKSWNAQDIWTLNI